MEAFKWWPTFTVLCISWVFLVAAQNELTRSGFPPGFLFGTASAAYQHEGAANEGGRGPSVWDTISHLPGEIANGDNGDVGVDEYHRYKHMQEDVRLMKEMGLNAYRFSISWSRILPQGTLKGGINKVGVAYYNNLINELLKNDIKPFVTLFHWNTPQALQDQYGGFLTKTIVKDFEAFSELCFQEFGDRVKHWITLNEPHSYATREYFYSNGTKAAAEEYILSHNLLLSHAAAVSVYKRKYQAVQKGLIGITIGSFWYVPYSNSLSDRKAAQRAIDFMFGRYMDPIAKGEYPSSMRNLVGSRLPKFSARENAMVKGSFDFLGLNYYTSRYAADLPGSTVNSEVSETADRNGVPIGPVAASGWLYVYPPGIGKLLSYIKRIYDNPLIFITENGVDEKNDDTLPLKQVLNDTLRIDYHSKHLSLVQKEIRNGSNIQGYFVWSLIDNFEWRDGFTLRFGLYYVDYNNYLNRYPKASVHWFRKLLEAK